jgi:clan AA aspartic protease
MITGVVNAYREAIIRLPIRGSTGQEQEIEAVVDTGFDGWLTLPTSMIAALGLAWRGRGRAILADGSESLFDTYEVEVIWDSQPRQIPVDAIEADSLVGMSLLYGYNLHIQVVDGGSVTIDALP